MKRQKVPVDLSAANRLQDQVLLSAIAARMPMRIYLVNGLKLTGEIVSMDRYSVLLRSNRAGLTSQLVFKSVIASVAPDDAEFRDR